MWKPKELISLKTFALLCVACFLLLYCVVQFLQVQDMTVFIEDFNQDLLIDEIDEEDLDYPTERTKPVGIDEVNLPTFQPNVAAEFPHIVHGSTRIPHIIHQMCNIPLVPDQFMDAMKSFVYYNPTWQYRFWTYDSGRLLLEKYHPYLVEIYDKFGENDVKKSDLLRYAIIYEYGGVYADLDVKNVRSLNKTTTKYACILPTEPFEHAGIIYLQEVVMSSAVLLCRPKHPFYKLLLLNLQLADPRGHPVGTTGPVYLTEIYLKYNNMTKVDLTKTVHNNRSNSPYFYKGKLDEESDDGIYIPNSQYFMDDVDIGMKNATSKELNACFEVPLYKQLIIKQRACKEFESRKQLRKERRYTFTIHYWFHLWTQDDFNQDLLIDEIDEEDLDYPTENKRTRPFGIDEVNLPTFQPNVAAEFPHIVNGSTRIPHIIHQMCNIPLVPDQFMDAMKSFVYYNPTWQYRFWTYDSGRLLLEKYHPYLVEIYDKFGENDVKKSDLLRYAILYEYGGVYADLDVKNVRSLNKTTTKYACILPTEPFEHAGIIYLQEVVMSSAVLLCRPKHPFFKMLLLNLQLADPRGHPVGTTGPVYLTEIYLRYNNMTKVDLTKTVHNNRSNSPYFYKGKLDEESDDGIYIPNSQYFMDDVDIGMQNATSKELNACFEVPLHKQLIIKQRACKEFESRKQLRKERRYTFTIHYWFHLWSQGQDHMRRCNIKDFLPTAVLYIG